MSKEGEMSKVSNWFVFYVQTGEEHRACEILNKLFDKNESMAFVPQVELVFKNARSIRKELRPMFPGYVFTDSTLDERVFASLSYRYITFSKCIYYLLKDENLNCKKLNEDEKRFLLGFCNDEYVVEDSKGFIVGDKVFITSGPLQGKESIIRKINRHKRRVEIELMWFGNLKRVSVSLEIVSKIK